MPSYDDLLLSAGTQHKRGTLQWDYSPEQTTPVKVLLFKSKASNKPVSISPSDIASFSWTELHDGYQLTIELVNGGTTISFKGFPAKAQQDIQDMIKTFGNDKELQMEKISTKGKNAGIVNITDQNLSMYVDDEVAFRVPIPLIAQSVAQSRNEIAIEFIQNETGLQSEGLYEMRIFAPEDFTNEDEEKSDEDEDKPTPAQAFAAELNSKGNLSEKEVSKPIAAFDNLFLLVPRARFDVELYATFLKLYNKTHSHRVLYKNINRMFLFDNPDHNQHLFVISLDTPMRQGSTRYFYVVFRFDSSEYLEQTFDIDEATCNEKYGGLIKPKMKGPIYDVVTRVFKAITKGKVLVPGQGFQSRNGSAAVRCAVKANDGHLFMLEKSFFFLHKPVIYLRHQQISQIEFDRTSSVNKTFDLKILAEGTEYAFTGIQRDEYERLFAFLKTKNINLLTSGEDDTRAESGRGRGGEYEDDAYMRTLDVERAAVGVGGDEDLDSSEDEDFTSGGSGSESGSSSESDSDMASEFSEDAQGGGQSKKKSSDKSEKKSSSKKDKEPAKSKEKSSGPKRATTAFFAFSNAKRKEVQERNPEIKGIGEIAKIMGEKWKSLTEEEKEPYNAIAAADKERYEKEKAEWASDDEGNNNNNNQTKKKRKTADKDDNAPKKPMSAYFLYMNAMRGQMHKDNPNMKMPEISKELAAKWKEMKEDDKQEYVEMNLQAKQKYERDLKEYKKTHANVGKDKKKKKSTSKDNNMSDDE